MVEGLNTVVWPSCAFPILVFYLVHIIQLTHFIPLGDYFQAIIKPIGALGSILQDAAVICVLIGWVSFLGAAILCLFFMLIEALQCLLHRQVKAAIMIIVIPSLIWTVTLWMLSEIS